MMVTTHVDLPMDKIAGFCRRWKIREFALFGSVLRDDFGPMSDVDVLVDFDPDNTWSLLDHVQMEDELAELWNRPVDVVTKKAVERSENPYRKRNILNSAHVIYTN